MSHIELASIIFKTNFNNGGNGGTALSPPSGGGEANGGNGGSFNKDHNVAGLHCDNGGNGGRALMGGMAIGVMVVTAQQLTDFVVIMQA